MSRVSPFVARSFSRRSRASPRSFAPSDVLNLTSAPRPASSLHAAYPVEDRDGAEREDLSEIGKLAVWSVTSAKPGNGVELLRDNNLDTYWQSDGAQPHLVNIQFQKKVRVREVAIYADYKLDESYTPSKISIRAGNSFDLREIKVVDLEEPVSGCTSDSERQTAAADEMTTTRRACARTPPARRAQQPPERTRHACDG